MEEQFNKEEALIKKLLHEAGTQSPSPALKNRVMELINARNTVVKPYQPLISKTVWAFIIAIFIIAVPVIYFGFYSDFTLDLSNRFTMPNEFRFPQLHLSSTMQYAIVFLAMFFLQIPFLKRFMDNQYRF